MLEADIYSPFIVGILSPLIVVLSESVHGNLAPDVRSRGFPEPGNEGLRRGPSCSESAVLSKVLHAMHRT